MESSLVAAVRAQEVNHAGFARLRFRFEEEARKGCGQVIARLVTALPNLGVGDAAALRSIADQLQRSLAIQGRGVKDLDVAVVAGELTEIAGLEIDVVDQVVLEAERAAGVKQKVLKVLTPFGEERLLMLDQTGCWIDTGYGIDGGYAAIGGIALRRVARGGVDGFGSVHSRSHGNTVQPFPGNDARLQGVILTVPPTDNIALNARNRVDTDKAAKVIRPVVVAAPGVEGNDIPVRGVHGHVGHIPVLGVIRPIHWRIHAVRALQHRSQLVAIDRAIAIGNDRLRTGREADLPDCAWEFPRKAGNVHIVVDPTLLIPHINIVVIPWNQPHAHRNSEAERVSGGTVRYDGPVRGKVELCRRIRHHVPYLSRSFAIHDDHIPTGKVGPVCIEIAESCWIGAVGWCGGRNLTIIRLTGTNGYLRSVAGIHLHQGVELAIGDAPIGNVERTVKERIGVRAG